MAYKKRMSRYSRRRRVKRDVLNFSLCGDPLEIDFRTAPGPTDGLGTCTRPLIDVRPLILGGQAGYSGGDGVTTQVLSLYAADQAERGATIGGFRFKYSYFDNGYINTGGADNTVAVTHVLYSAIAKLEYDNDAYRSTGILNLNYLPNIVGGVTDTLVGGSHAQPLGDINADLLWRDVCWVGGRPLDSALYSATPIQEWQDFQRTNKSQTSSWNSIRVKRRLKENEGLFWVTNVVTGLPQFNVEFEQAYIAELVMFVYGVAAAKLR